MPTNYNLNNIITSTPAEFFLYTYSFFNMFLIKVPYTDVCVMHHNQLRSLVFFGFDLNQ